MKWNVAAAVVAGAVFAASGRAETATWTLHNPAGEFVDEMVRVPVTLKAPYEAAKLVVKEDGKEVAYQVSDGDIWVCTTVGKGGSHVYEVTTGGAPAKFESRAKVTRPRAGVVEVGNGLVRVALPDVGANKDEKGDFPGPILGVGGKEGALVGESDWELGGHKLLDAREATGLKVTIEEGPLFVQVNLAYQFTDINDKAMDWAKLSFKVVPGRAVVFVDETHQMGKNSAWVFEMSKGWNARQCLVQINNGGGGPGGNSPGNSLPKDKWPTDLKAGQTRMGNTHLFLLPRWSQAFDDGWLFALHDGTSAVAAIPARAGKWVWPHENKIAVKVKESGDYAALRLPTHRGSRSWILAAGPVEMVKGDAGADLVRRTTMQNLDKIVNDYISEWPGQKGSFQGAFFFGSDTNPTGGRRGMGRAAVANAGKKGDLSTLFWAQVNLDPDWYGSYYNHWSPENPNFFTDFSKTGVALVAQLREHPRFAELRAMAEAKVREDLDFSVTLPGGAGQECPGYLAHATTQWKELAPMCKQYLGFDPTTWPRYQAAIGFQRHVSYPDGNIRRQNPAGDTHPGKGGGNVIEMAGEDVTKFVTEELPGFGVVFRNNAGTPGETYLAWKSGPNRGHYHGDQLAFHYCADGKPVAVDHHCSYHPRAGQEHMHNRVAFSIEGKAGFEYENMDGYERVIAFKPGKEVDIAMGQVESTRLRAMDKLPPEEWDQRWRKVDLETPLVYRRTMVQVKAASGGKDYFVVRDQYWSGWNAERGTLNAETAKGGEGRAKTELAAHWQLHVLGNKVERKGNLIACNGVNVFVAAPKEFGFEKFEWEHDNGGVEHTAGPRLTVKGASGEFVTVIYPGEKLPAMEAIAGGVKVGTDEIVFGNYVGNKSENFKVGQDAAEVTVKRGGKTVGELMASGVDFERSQGEIGLFVPDAGYPFGEIPDWLAKQRGGKRKE